MSSEEFCSIDRLIPQELTVGYAALYCLILVIVAIYGFREFYVEKDSDVAICSKEFAKGWLGDVWNKKKCFLPILTHIFDQVTDFGIIYGFGRLSMNDNCDDINAFYLFLASVIAFLFYRIVCGIGIVRETGSVWRFFVQLFDLEIFRAVWVNYKTKSDTPSSPQRWIQNLEAILEAFPQTLIQLFYVMKTSSLDSFVVLSLSASLYAIVTKTVTEDKILFKEKWKHAQFKLLSMKYWKKGECISKLFVIRFFFRFMDITSRICIILLVWIVIGGFSIIIVFGLEMLMLCALAVWAGEYVCL